MAMTEASYGGLSPAKAQRPSPFNRIGVAADMLAKLEAALGNVSSRLVGDGPEDVSRADDRAVPSGAFGELDDVASGMIARIDRMSAAVNRIADQLP